MSAPSKPLPSSSSTSQSASSKVVVKIRAPNWPKMVSYKNTSVVPSHVRDSSNVNGTVGSRSGNHLDRLSSSSKSTNTRINLSSIATTNNQITRIAIKQGDKPASMINNNTTYLGSPRESRKLAAESSSVAASNTVLSLSKSSAPEAAPLPIKTSEPTATPVDILIQSKIQLVRQCQKCQVLFVNGHVCD